MSIKSYILYSLLCCMPALVSAEAPQKVDICIYGGTSAGVIAAYTAKQAGKSVLLIEPGKRLGGLTTGGLGYTDIGNKYVISGLARDFYRRIGSHYGKFEQWTFEPGVAEGLMKSYISKANVPVWYGYVLQGVTKKGTAIHSIEVVPVAGGKKRVVQARVFIDCSYEGDLMAKAGVSYTVGREANSQYNETYNGVQMMDKHQFPDGVDPYKIPGNPSSGLLWGISPEPLAAAGTGDKKVQAYNFRLCLTNNKDNMVPVTRPAGYDSTKYELLLRVLARKPAKNLGAFMKYDYMPNRKTDINNNGAFSTDMIGMNYDYPEANYARRQQIIADHSAYIKGFLYFIGHDPRMPEHLRLEMQQWGYPKDEYTDTGYWSPQMYVREARRMVGAYVMTQHHCQGRETAPGSVGMAAYTMDSHNCQRVVHNGMVKNEGDVQIGGFPPYPIAYLSLTPKADQCTNLLVPVCLSASHIAFGSIRMEPVFMVLAQSSALAACQAIDRKVAVQQVDVTALRQRLAGDPLMDGSTPEILIDNDITPDQVRTSGTWTAQSRGGSQFGAAYGASMLIDTTKGKTPQTVSYQCQTARSGRFQLLLYIPSVTGQASTLNIKVSTGERTVTFTKDVSAVRNDWLMIDTFDLKAGEQNTVQIISDRADGIVVADAVLWKP